MNKKQLNCSIIIFCLHAFSLHLIDIFFPCHFFILYTLTFSFLSSYFDHLDLKGIFANLELLSDLIQSLQFCHGPYKHICIDISIQMMFLQKTFF